MDNSRLVAPSRGTSAWPAVSFHCPCHCPRATWSRWGTATGDCCPGSRRTVASCTEAPHCSRTWNSRQTRRSKGQRRSGRTRGSPRRTSPINALPPRRCRSGLEIEGEKRINSIIHSQLRDKFTLTHHFCPLSFWSASRTWTDRDDRKSRTCSAQSSAYRTNSDPVMWTLVECSCWGSPTGRMEIILSFYRWKTKAGNLQE